jgi:hypothetical protein
MEEEDYGAKLVKKAGGTLSARPSLDQQIRRLFPFSPTPGQEVLFKKMAGWLEKNVRL